MKRLLKTLASPSVPFAVLPVLMLILVVGTIAQRYIGLYDAQKMFLSSWVAGIPLGILTISLFIKFIFFSKWSREKAGINLTHLGVLILLIGGLFTAMNAKEGALLIPEGAASNIVEDFHLRELTITPSNAPFTVKTLESCRNCEIVKQEDKTGKRRGMAASVALKPKKAEKNNEDNLYGVTVEVSGISEKQDGIYLLFDIMPKPLEFNGYQVNYGRQQRKLPFEVELKDFVKQDHPGTRIARAYSSDVIIHDGKISFPSFIEMNTPLRYKGYTLFQSSFVMFEGKEATVLSVVQNKAWVFPYMGTGIMAIGLLLHTLIMFMKGRKRHA